MSKAVNPEAFAALWEMAKGPLVNPEDLYSYEIEEASLDQIGPWNSLKTAWAIPYVDPTDRDRLADFLEWHFSELDIDLSDDEIKGKTEERIQQIEQGSPLAEEEESEWYERQWVETELLSNVTFFSCEHGSRELYWVGEFEPSGMGRGYARSFGPFRSLDDAWSIVSAMKWPDVETD